MEEQILQLLKGLKENQEEIKADIQKINNRIDDIERDISCIELVTSKNWMDITRLKQDRKVLNIELKESKREDNTTDTLKFLQHKIRGIEEEIFLLNDKIKQ